MSTDGRSASKIQLPDNPCSKACGLIFFPTGLLSLFCLQTKGVLFCSGYFNPAARKGWPLRLKPRYWLSANAAHSLGWHSATRGKGNVFKGLTGEGLTENQKRNNHAG